MLAVEKTKHGHYSITNGVKWFFFAYTTREAADNMLSRLIDQNTAHLNIAHQRPYKLIE